MSSCFKAFEKCCKPFTTSAYFFTENCSLLLVILDFFDDMRAVMPPSPFAYSPQSQYFPSLSYSDHLQLNHHQEFSMHNDQQMPSPSSSSIPIDPALALYPPYYSSYQQHPSQLQHHLSLPPNYSSPSSQGSDTIGTPPTEIMMYPSSSSNINGKRPSSSISMDSRKKARKDDESETHSPAADKEEVKAKPTRGSRFILPFHMLI